MPTPEAMPTPGKGFFLPLLLAVILLAPVGVLGAQQYNLPIDVGTSVADRVDKPVDAAIDLTAFMALVGGSLDLASFQVVEVDDLGQPLDTAVLFQFDPVPGFDPATQASGNLVFVMDGVTPAATIRYYQLWFDTLGGCPDCPAPPVVPVPVAVDSLTYENQLTYHVATPRADYYYHAEGAGFASIIDNDGQDWVSFHDVAGSNSAGEYRGLPNLVFKSGAPQDSYFHPGFTNAHSNIVSSGPLKVTVFSETDDGGNLWQLLWEFYPDYARMTVLTVGTTNGGDYWFLYEGTVGGSMDSGDEVTASPGLVTSAYAYADVWESILPDPAWVYFRDQSDPRVFFVSDDQGDNAPDSYRPQGQSAGSTPQMTVFGYGRVLNTSPDKLIPRMSGTGRSFTIGFGEDHLTAEDDIAGAVQPLTVILGEPGNKPSAVEEGSLPAAGVGHGNYPNPFNPRTVIAFNLPTASRVRLEVLDLQGRKVAGLVDGNLAAGPHEVVFEGRDLPSGIYLSRLTTPAGTSESKMMLVR